MTIQKADTVTALLSRFDIASAIYLQAFEALASANRGDLFAMSKSEAFTFFNLARNSYKQADAAIQNYTNEYK